MSLHFDMPEFRHCTSTASSASAHSPLQCKSLDICEGTIGACCFHELCMMQKIRRSMPVGRRHQDPTLLQRLEHCRSEKSPSKDSDATDFHAVVPCLTTPSRSASSSCGVQAAAMEKKRKQSSGLHRLLQPVLYAAQADKAAVAYIHSVPGAMLSLSRACERHRQASGRAKCETGVRTTRHRREQK